MSRMCDVWWLTGVPDWNFCEACFAAARIIRRRDPNDRYNWHQKYTQGTSETFDMCSPRSHIVTLAYLIFVVCAYNSNHIPTLSNETFLWQWSWFTWRYNDNNSDDEDEDDDERNPVSQSGVGSCDQIMCSSCLQQIISTLAAHSRGFTSEDFFWITWWLFLDFLVILFLTNPQANAWISLGNFGFLPDNFWISSWKYLNLLKSLEFLHGSQKLYYVT